MHDKTHIHINTHPKCSQFQFLTTFSTGFFFIIPMKFKQSKDSMIMVVICQKMQIEKIVC